MGFRMRRGEIRLVDLEPAVGSEANKRRPAVIVSNDSANRSVELSGRGTVTVVPLTSNTKRILPFQVALPKRESGLARDSKAPAEQVRTVAAQRVGEKLGVVPSATMCLIDDALRLHLDL